MDDAKLVFQPVAADSESAAFADALLDVAQHTSELRLVSPFLGVGVIAPLTFGRRFRLVTDLRACFEAGADTKLVRFLVNHSGSIRDAPGVHAKVVLGDKAAMVGSANLTQQAICYRLEMGCLLNGAAHIRQLSEWFDALWEIAGKVEEGDVRSLEQTARANAAARRSGTGRLTGPLHSRRGSLGWLASIMPTTTDDIEHRATTPRSPPGLHEIDELAEHIRHLASSRVEARLILGTLREALEIAALDVEDDRLHLNFSNRKVSITIGQRDVSWYGRRKKGNNLYMGFLLDDFGAADEVVHRLPGADSSAFTREGKSDAPSLYVPIDQLPRLPERGRESWHRGIRREVERAGPSSDRAKKKRSLYSVLMHPDGIAETVCRAFPQGWWFGVNNSSRGHMQLDAVLPLLRGEVNSLVWPIGQSKPRAAYREMLPGDRALVWTGHGKDPTWGLLGTAIISDAKEDHIVLGDGMAFGQPLIPYPKGQPMETDTVRFLRDQLGAEFAPLGDVMRAVYSTPRRHPVTVAPVPVEVLEAISLRGKEG